MIPVPAASDRLGTDRLADDATALPAHKTPTPRSHIQYTQIEQLHHKYQSTIMDYVKNLAGGNAQKNPEQAQQTQQTSSGGGFMDSINSALGGGQKSEAKEDHLDKGN